MSGCTLTIRSGPGPSCRHDDDTLVAFLCTIAEHLEDRVGGSRFPILFMLAHALRQDVPPIAVGDVDTFAEDLASVRRELADIPAAQTPTFVFGDEGSAEIYSAETPRLRGTAADRFGWVIDALQATASAARAGRHEISLERAGPRVAWWD